MFIWGMWLFAFASLGGGLAQSDVWLIVARADARPGRGAHLPGVLALVTTYLRRGAERNKALGVWGTVAGSGASPPACCWAASSPRRSAGSGCCS